MRGSTCTAYHDIHVKVSDANSNVSYSSFIRATANLSKFQLLIVLCGVNFIHLCLPPPLARLGKTSEQLMNAQVLPIQSQITFKM